MNLGDRQAKTGPVVVVVQQQPAIATDEDDGHVKPHKRFGHENPPEGERGDLVILCQKESKSS